MTTSIESTAHAPTRRKPRLSEHWDAARGVVFGAVKVSEKGRTRSRRRIDVFMASLKQHAMQGDTHADRQIRRLRSHLEQKGILDDPAEISEGQREIQRRTEEHNAYRKWTSLFMSVAHACFEQDLKAEHLKRHGTPFVSRCETPLGVEQALCDRFLFLVHQRRRQLANRDGAEPVGHKKPPKHTQWKPNQSGNPSGRRKHVDDDGWAAFRTAFLERVPARVNGRSVSLSSDEVICIRSMDLACKGDRAARKAMCDLLIELDRRRILCPKSPRKRRKKPSPEQLATWAKFNPIMLALCRIKLIEARKEDVEAVFGPQPEFDRDLDRQWSEAQVRLNAALAERQQAA